MTETVREASTVEDYAAFGALVVEYWDWLLARYAVDAPGFMEAVRSHQSLDDELASLPSRYGPPEGRALLAEDDGELRGVIALHDLHDGSCEMKRMFVPERFQGRGTGRRLVQALVEVARADGYALMRLDTGYLNTEAMAMYAGLGFTPCGPYQDYPQDIVGQLRFMQLPLEPS